ncbi:hypothetical protein BASA81_004215 [Batrachochytrium salamandrivorans]|nr:hypothetical protein BASA81_004215 [Batrachochytrium salamandrivorans]
MLSALPKRALVVVFLLWLLNKRYGVVAFFREQYRRNLLLRKLPGPPCTPEFQHRFLGHIGKPGVILHEDENALDSDHVSAVLVARFQEIARKHQAEGMVRFFGLNSQIPLALGGVVMLTSFEMVKEVLNFEASTKVWHKGRSYDVSEVLIGNSVLRAFGQAWHTQRLAVEKAMHHMVNLPLTMDRVVKTVDLLVNKWSKLPKGSEVKVSEETLKLTMDVIGKAAFSHDFHSVVADESTGAAPPLYAPFQIILTTLNERCRKVHEMLFTWVPTEANLAFNDAIGKLNSQVHGLINKRSQSQDRKGDLLDTLLETEGISRELIKDNVQTMLFAGHDTTGAALTWMLRLLATHPEKMVRVREEILNKFGKDRSPETNEDLECLVYLNAVVLETLRLYPSAAFTKMSDEDVLMGGKHTIPAGTEVLILPYLIHRDARYWDNPDEFSPERFVDMEMLPNGDVHTNSLQSRIGRICTKKAYLPFSLGPRNCVGRALALMEMRVVLVKLLQRFSFDLPPNQQIGQVSSTPVFSLTLNPPGEIALIPVIPE